MQGLQGRPTANYDAINAAANKIMKNFPQNVNYVDKATVESWNIELGPDNLHPTDAGYNTLAKAIFDFFVK